MKTFSLGVFATFAVFITLPTLSSAQTFKCVVDGHTTYQDAPCANGVETPVDDSPAAAGITGLRKDADRMAVKEAREANAQKAAAPVRKRATNGMTMQETKEYLRRNCTKNTTPGGHPGWGYTC